VAAEAGAATGRQREAEDLPQRNALRVLAGSCQPTTTPAGDTLTTIPWALQLAARALAALFIAGFTGIVRKT
jgi:hypothetical protein